MAVCRSHLQLVMSRNQDYRRRYVVTARVLANASGSASAPSVTKRNTSTDWSMASGVVVVAAIEAEHLAGFSSTLAAGCMIALP
jgi:hypothetical protein